MFPTTGVIGDEDVYLRFAGNLAHGFYSPPPPDIDLGKGPGYPILLAPFVALHVPLIWMALLNAVFYYLSIVFLFKSLQTFSNSRVALVVSLFWAFYYNLYETIPLIIAEVFSPFLVSLLLYSLIQVYTRVGSVRKKYIYLSGIVLGYLSLTKPIFGYVLVVMIIISGLLWLVKRYREVYKKGFLILLIAFGTTVPYLAYTFHLTGRMFYWASSGGNNLYWMSTPYKDEYGSWIDYPLPEDAKLIPGSKDSIITRHQKDYEEVSKFTGVEQDDAYKRLAMRNIKSHPVKYIRNCISNIGRIVFNYPFSYKPQKPGTLLRFPLSGIVVVLMLLCVFPTFKNWSRIPYYFRFLLLMSVIYFGGSIFGSAETRMFNVIVPMLLAYIAFVLTRTVKINFNFSEGKSIKEIKG